ncbi:hypothetical protein UFOVP264_27 [uncultured Caudovirales phage]|uniref:Uncharacterized protein n=1 Tax=uncultured Caudovirales phage TaxID=2100421 RepID=A0A6J5LL31_9CAUD|nr:hypothetical protein UFOVP264_27 [uncultured Caudovirales phage]
MIKEIGTEGKKFYFQGKWFDSSEEMFSYAVEWNSFLLNRETAERILDKFKKDLLINIFMAMPSFTNREFSNKVEEVLLFAIQKLREKI